MGRVFFKIIKIIKKVAISLIKIIKNSKFVKIKANSFRFHLYFTLFLSSLYFFAADFIEHSIINTIAHNIRVLLRNSQSFTPILLYLQEKRDYSAAM